MGSIGDEFDKWGKLWWQWAMHEKEPWAKIWDFKYAEGWEKQDIIHFTEKKEGLSYLEFGLEGHEVNSRK